ncbi:MAG: hypothetical protein ABFD00_10590 [Chloroherpetonaceae bacterium]
MTASLFNNSNGSFANVVDGFVYPQFIGYANRAPTTSDIYNPGTRWQDNSVNPAVVYETTGAGNWSATNTSGSFTNLTAAGTVNLNASGTGVTTIGTGGTGATNIGNATGNTTVTGDLNISGNLNLSSVAKLISMNGGAVTDFIGTAILVNGTVTVANTNITAADRILVVHEGLNASTAVGILTYSISAATSFTITAVKPADGTTETGDLSTVAYVIFRQT